MSEKNYIVLENLYEKVWKKLERASLIPEELEIDYHIVNSFSKDKEVCVESIGFACDLSYDGGSEGIYLDIYVGGVFSGDEKKRIERLCTIKTLNEDDASMLAMGKLYGAFCIKADNVLRKLDSRSDDYEGGEEE